MANWLNFEKVKQWDYLLLPFFQYDAISDADIQAALGDPLLARVDVACDWEDDVWLAGAQGIPEDRKHAYRVAAIVAALQAGQALDHGIELDTYCVGYCGCSVGNGHHRVRALQYLGVPAGPFWLSGALDALEELVALAGEPGPSAAQASYFSLRLRTPQPEDVQFEMETAA